MQTNKRFYGRIDQTCIEICNRCHFHIIIPRVCEVVLKVALANVKYLDILGIEIFNILQLASGHS